MFIYTSFRIAMKLYNLDTLLESYIVPSLWNSYSLRFGIYTFWAFGIHTPTSFHTYTLWHFKFMFEAMDTFDTPPGLWLVCIEALNSYVLRFHNWNILRFWIHTSWGLELKHISDAFKSYTFWKFLELGHPEALNSY